MGWPRRDLADLFGVEHPIIQAPMAGASTPEMAAAVANRGGVGSLGVALKSPDGAVEEIRAAQGLTNRALNVNFFCHEPPETDAAKIADATARLAPFYEEYGLGEPVAPHEASLPFNEAMLEVVLAASPRVASFHFGLPDERLLAPLKQAGVVVISSATSPAEAEWLAERGADAIIAQGWEAGGHRGVFDHRRGPGEIGTMALVPQIVDRVDLPVIAAGGIADGRGVAAAFMLGASGAQIGTAFLRSPESMAPAVHKAALAAARAEETVITAGFSGRPARGLRNRFTEAMAGVETPDFPLMNPATGPLRAASAKAGDGAFVSLWSGQAVELTRAEPAGEVFDRIVAEALGLLG